MAGGNDLALARSCHIGKQAVGLALAENVQVRIGFVQEQDRAGIRVHVGQKEESLLHAAPGRGHVKCRPAFAVAHNDLAALRHVTWRFDFHSKQVLDLRRQLFPVFLLLRVNLEAKVTQHLRRAPFPHPHIHSALCDSRFRRRKSRHRRQKRDPL